MIIFWAIVSLVIVHLSAPFAGAATMADMELYMNSHENVKDLPDYCKCRLAEAKFREKFRSKHSPKQIDWPAQFAKVRDKWDRIIGKKNWRHIHHYCFGIQKLNRSLRMTEKSNELRRKGTLRYALEEFEYMRRAADRSFPLWPQLFMYEYQIYLQLGEPAKAQRAMQQAAKYQKRRKSRR